MTTPSPNPDDVTTRLRDLCSPLAEILADKARIDAFVKYGSQAADLIDLLRRHLIAERERCLSIASNERSNRAGSDDFNRGGENSAAIIEAAIREGEA